MSTSPTLSPSAAGDALVPHGSWRVGEESLIGFTVAVPDDRAAID